MIIKYRKEEAWCFMSGVRQVSNIGIDTNGLIEKYNSELLAGETDIASEGVNSSDVANTNKAFIKASESFEIEGGNSHTENLLHVSGVSNNVSASIVILNIEEHNEYDCVVLITNQPTYLMNDKGQTIERLV